MISNRGFKSQKGVDRSSAFSWKTTGACSDFYTQQNFLSQYMAKETYLSFKVDKERNLQPEKGLWHPNNTKNKKISNKHIKIREKNHTLQ